VYDDELLVSLVQRIMQHVTDAAVNQDFRTMFELRTPGVNVVKRDATTAPDFSEQRADGADGAGAAPVLPVSLVNVLRASPGSNYRETQRVHAAFADVSNDALGEHFARSEFRDNPFVAVATAYCQDCWNKDVRNGGCTARIPRNMDSCLKASATWTGVACESVRADAWVCPVCDKLSGPGRTSCRYRLENCTGTQGPGCEPDLTKVGGLLTAPWAVHDRKLNGYRVDSNLAKLV